MELIVNLPPLLYFQRQLVIQQPISMFLSTHCFNKRPLIDF